MNTFPLPIRNSLPVLGFWALSLVLLPPWPCPAIADSPQSAQLAEAKPDSRFKAKLVAEKVWCIDDKGADNFYLVEGKDKALLIDTGTGAGHLKEYLVSLTKLPIIVANTHGHPDHAGGNFEFDQVYAHPADFEMIQKYGNQEKRAGNANPKSTVLNSVKQGYQFDLGGRKLEVVEVPGHTKGSICLLDSRHRILFTGDNDNSLVWLFLKECTPLEIYLQTLEKLNQRAGEFETILPGHGIPLDKTFIGDQISCARKILNGTCPGKPYKSFAGDALVCTSGKAAIAFNPENLRQKQ
jgi:glyoxylase-like metal-dependent hydrolase (beta-lactamase superfamily II)